VDKTSGVANLKFEEGAEMFHFRLQQQYFVWDTASQSTNWLDIPKIGGGPPWLRLWTKHGINCVFVR